MGMMATSRGQPGKGCVEASQYADLAFSLACSSVLGGPQGLLVNAGEEVGELLDRCSAESQPGARWTAVDQLIGLLGGDEGSGEQDEKEEGEDEEGDDDIEESTGTEGIEHQSQSIAEDDEE